MIRTSTCLVVAAGLIAIGTYAVDSRAQDASTIMELPPNAAAGECYAKVSVPAKYRTETQKVMLKEASEKIQIAPAKYEWVEEKILVKEGYDNIVAVPAKYKWVEEKVMVTPATETVEEVPAAFEWVEEKVLVKPAQVVWKKGSGPIQKVDNATGEIMCRVEEPAVHKIVKKKKLKTPATTKKIAVPAQYKTVKKQVIDTKATTKTVKVDPTYTVMKVKKLVTPAQEKRVPVPAEFTEVSKSIKVGDAKVEWKPVLCQTNMSGDIVTSLQRALKGAGFDPGPVDGVIGGQTMTAISSYQKSKGLAQGALTMDTLRSLNVRVN